MVKQFQASCPGFTHIKYVDIRIGSLGAFEHRIVSFPRAESLGDNYWSEPLSRLDGLPGIILAATPGYSS